MHRHIAYVLQATTFEIAPYLHKSTAVKRENGSFTNMFSPFTAFFRGIKWKPPHHEYSVGQNQQWRDDQGGQIKVNSKYNNREDGTCRASN